MKRILFTVLMLMCVGNAYGQSLTITMPGGLVADAWIEATSVDASHGGDANQYVGELSSGRFQMVFMRFFNWQDSTTAQGITWNEIDSAVVSWYLVSMNGTVPILEVYGVKLDSITPGSSDGAASAGEVTWSSARHEDDPAWNSGGGSTEGTDVYAGEIWTKGIDVFTTSAYNDFNIKDYFVNVLAGTWEDNGWQFTPQNHDFSGLTDDYYVFQGHTAANPATLTLYYTPAMAGLESLSVTSTYDSVKVHIFETELTDEFTIFKIDTIPTPDDTLRMTEKFAIGDTATKSFLDTLTANQKYIIITRLIDTGVDSIYTNADTIITRPDTGSMTLGAGSGANIKLIPNVGANNTANTRVSILDSTKSQSNGFEVFIQLDGDTTLAEEFHTISNWGTLYPRFALGDTARIRIRAQNDDSTYKSGYTVDSLIMPSAFDSLRIIATGTTAVTIQLDAGVNSAMDSLRYFMYDPVTNTDTVWGGYQDFSNTLITSATNTDTFIVNGFWAGDSLGKKIIVGAYMLDDADKIRWYADLDSAKTWAVSVDSWDWRWVGDTLAVVDTTVKHASNVENISYFIIDSGRVSAGSTGVYLHPDSNGFVPNIPFRSLESYREVTDDTIRIFRGQMGQGDTLKLYMHSITRDTLLMPVKYYTSGGVAPDSAPIIAPQPYAAPTPVQNFHWDKEDGKLKWTKATDGELENGTYTLQSSDDDGATWDALTVVNQADITGAEGSYSDTTAKEDRYYRIRKVKVSSEGLASSVWVGSGVWDEATTDRCFVGIYVKDIGLEKIRNLRVEVSFNGLATTVNYVTYKNKTLIPVKKVSVSIEKAENNSGLLIIPLIPSALITDSSVAVDYDFKITGGTVDIDIEDITVPTSVSAFLLDLI